MDDNPRLRDATVQEIQLELIRRTSFNGFDGERVWLALLNHRDLWKAALLDRPGHLDRAEPRSFSSGLIKLRDLPDNDWNADTLFVLTHTQEGARRFARIGEQEGWAEDVYVYESDEEIGRAVGVFPANVGLVSFWWD